MFGAYNMSDCWVWTLANAENVSSLILGEPRGATLSIPCMNRPSLYREPRRDYYILSSSSVTHIWNSSRTSLKVLSGNTIPVCWTKEFEKIPQSGICPAPCVLRRLTSPHFWGLLHFWGCLYFSGCLHFWGRLHFWGHLHFEVIFILRSSS